MQNGGPVCKTEPPLPRTEARGVMSSDAHNVHDHIMHGQEQLDQHAERHLRRSQEKECAEECQRSILPSISALF
jgi:hypothetical protein